MSLNLERSSLRHLGNLHTINLDHCCHPQRPVFVGVTTGSRLNGEYLAEIHDRSLRSCIQVAAGRILAETRIDLIRYILSVLSSEQYIQLESGRSTPARLPANDEDLFLANRYPHGVLYPWKEDLKKTWKKNVVSSPIENTVEILEEQNGISKNKIAKIIASNRWKR